MVNEFFDYLFRRLYEVIDEESLKADFEAFNKAIDAAKEKYDMTEDEAIAFVAENWSFDDLKEKSND